VKGIRSGGAQRALSTMGFPAGRAGKIVSSGADTGPSGDVNWQPGQGLFVGRRNGSGAAVTLRMRNGALLYFQISAVRGSSLSSARASRQVG
jgi:hypothetical protein